MSNTARRIFLSPPFTGEAERKAVMAAFDSGYVAPCGPQVEEFERRIAALAGRRYAVAVSSGTAALDLAMAEYGVDGSWVVVAPTLTFIATVSPAYHRGAKLVFVDCDATGNIDPALLEQALADLAGRKRVMVIGVDLYGSCCDYAALLRLCRSYGAVFICDSAEAVGARYRKPGGEFVSAGSAGAAAVYSFNGNKIMTTSGGGALFDMGVYHISQLLYLTGIPELERVCGHTYAEVAMDEGRRAISGYNVEELGVGLATYKGGLSMDILESWAIHGKPFPSSVICGSEAGMSLSPLTIHSRKYNVETDTTVDLSEMDYLDHTVYADGAHYDNSQQHWVHALLGKCDLLPTAKIALETQRVQEGIYFSERLGREVTADEIEELSESKALEIPNLAL
jgi:hypothetical protein